MEFCRLSTALWGKSPVWKISTCKCVSENNDPLGLNPAVTQHTYKDNAAGNVSYNTIDLLT